MLNRFLRWLAPKPRPGQCFTFISDDKSRRAFQRIRLERQIATAKRNKKRHSHLQQELDSLT